MSAETDFIRFDGSVLDSAKRFRPLRFLCDTCCTFTILPKESVERLNLDVTPVGCKIQLEHGYAHLESHDLYRAILRMSTRDDGNVTFECSAILMDVPEAVLGMDALTEMFEYRIQNGVLFLIRRRLHQDLERASPSKLD